MNAVKLGCLGFLLFWGGLLGVVLLVSGGFSQAGAASANGPPLTCTWPVVGPVTTGFGMRVDPFPPHEEEMHWGIDIAAAAGTPVRAATAGKVIVAAWSGNYGNLVILASPGGTMVTYYGHLSGYAVSSGQGVAQGEVVGYVGSTGRSTGPHLHFETRPFGRIPADPLQCFIHEQRESGVA